MILKLFIVMKQCELMSIIFDRIANDSGLNKNLSINLTELNNRTCRATRNQHAVTIQNGHDHIFSIPSPSRAHGLTASSLVLSTL